jgi:hypothetical protein
MSTLSNRIRRTYGVPNELILDLQLELVTPVFADWHEELARISRAGCGASCTGCTAATTSTPSATS